MSGDGMECLWLTDGRAKKLLKDIEQLAPELLNKIKADAIRSVIDNAMGYKLTDDYEWIFKETEIRRYANQVERER